MLHFGRHARPSADSLPVRALCICFCFYLDSSFANMRHRPFCTLLLAVFTAWLHKTAGDEICALFPGSGWRDCVCGIEYRDQEKRCCDEHTCFQPEQMINNRTCSLTCENGMAFDSASGRCTQCKDGYFGTCCERGKCSC